MLTKAENDEVGNLAINVSGYCQGQDCYSMPVTREEWFLARRWEIENNAKGDLTFWMHVEPEWEHNHAD